MNTPEAKPRSSLNRWDRAFIVVTVLIAALTIFEWVFRMWHPYILGSKNQDYDMDIVAFLLFLGVGFTWLILPFWAISRFFYRSSFVLHAQLRDEVPFRAIFRRPQWMNGLLFFAISCLPLVIGFTLLYSPRVPGHIQYRKGFQAWVARNIDPAPIQSWLATQVVSDEIILVQPADWPPEIQRLNPERVDLYRGQGVVLSWGPVTRDESNRRQVFIGRTADSPPPTEVLWPGYTPNHDWAKWEPIDDGRPSVWQSAKPCVWWCLH